MTKTNTLLIAPPSVLLGANLPRSQRWRTVLLTVGFGFVGPIACFLVALLLGLDLFGRLAVAVHAAAALGVALLALHVSGRVIAPRVLALISGALLGSGFSAMLVGLLLLPLSAIALFFAGLGLLGFVPFGTAWVLFRAAREAWNASAILPWQLRIGLGMWGSALAVVLPLTHPAAQQFSYRVAFERLDRGTPDAIERANEALEWMPLLSVEPLVDEARWEENESRRDELCRLYELRFGEPLDIDVLSD